MSVVFSGINKVFRAVPVSEHQVAMKICQIILRVFPLKALLALRQQEAVKERQHKTLRTKTHNMSTFSVKAELVLGFLVLGHGTVLAPITEHC